jgi:hypothetical protein
MRILKKDNIKDKRFLQFFWQCVNILQPVVVVPSSPLLLLRGRSSSGGANAYPARRPRRRLFVAVPLPAPLHKRRTQHRRPAAAAAAGAGPRAAPAAGTAVRGGARVLLQRHPGRLRRLHHHRGGLLVLGQPRAQRVSRGVTAPVDPFENPNFETRFSRFHFIGSRVESHQTRHAFKRAVGHN